MRKVLLVCSVALLSACAASGENNTASTHKQTGNKTVAQAVAAAKEEKKVVLPKDVVVSEAASVDRAYKVVEDISVTIKNKSFFRSDAAQLAAKEALQEKASALGADAVINVKYEKPGLSPSTWGSFGATGQAVSYK